MGNECSPLDDTSNCPVLKQCESCGSEDDDLAVATVNYGFGVMCVTLCEPCTDGELPSINVITAAKRGLMHAEHLSMDLDQIAEVLEAEKAAERPSGFGL